MNNPSPIERLIAKWKAAKVPIQSPCTETEINAFESRFAVTVPDDLKHFLILANGTSSLVLDNDGYAFWSLNEFKPVSSMEHQESINWPEDTKKYFCFMDWLLNSDVFAISLYPNQSGTNPIIRVFDKSQTVLAQSFTDFVEKYLANPDFAL
jgi:SMI1 / KNR4 family (SUKH-1)